MSLGFEIMGAPGYAAWQRICANEGGLAGWVPHYPRFSRKARRESVSRYRRMMLAGNDESHSQSMSSMKASPGVAGAYYDVMRARNIGQHDALR